MPHLRLVPISARFGFGVGSTGFGGGEFRNLSYRVTPDRPLRRQVRLTGQEKFDDLEGTLILSRGETKAANESTASDEASVEERPVIGMLNYLEKFEDDFYPHPAGYSVEIVLQPELFDELLHMGRLGKAPSSFSVEASGKGIKHGWEPDGSGVDWDNKQFPNVPIRFLSVGLPLVLSPEEIAEMREDDLPNVQELPPTREQIEQLGARVDSISSQLSKLPGAILLATVALGVVVAYF